MNFFLRQQYKAIILLATSPIIAHASLVDEINICVDALPKNYDLAHVSQTVNFTLTHHQLYDHLVKPSKDGLGIVPSLALRWQVFDDGRRYRFELRQDVSFHSQGDFKPKRLMNASDVVFSFNRLLNPPAHYSSLPKSTSMVLKNLEYVTVIDPYTVEFSLHEADLNFPVLLYDVHLPILSAEYANFLGIDNELDGLAKKPVGTGPFLFVSADPNNSVLFKRFEKHWGVRAEAAKIRYLRASPATARYSKFKAGKCSVATGMDRSLLKAISTIDGAKIQRSEPLNITHLYLNSLYEPLADARVRRALHHAIDKDRIVRLIFSGGATAAPSLYPPSLRQGTDFEAIDYDPTRARELLAEAGYPTGFELRLSMGEYSMAARPNPSAIALLIQRNLEDIGLDVELELFDRDKYRKYRNRELPSHSLISTYSGNSNVALDFVRPLFLCEERGPGGYNYTGWCSTELDELSKRIVNQNLSAHELSSYLSQSINLLNRENPSIPLWHSPSFDVLAKNTSGFERDLFINLNLRHLKSIAK